MSNRLATETSPYLLQHAHNPVDWYPWGPEALERARREQKPILLSVGYAACHWCHVMERESFEDEATARVMNEHFVNIKVDREERPDIDAIYMAAVQAMTGHGGWPMTVFLTPEGVPFWGGTYLPPEDRHGIPSFTKVMRAIHDAWTARRGDVEHTAQQMRGIYASAEEAAVSTGAPTPELLDRATQAIRRHFDPVNGGFGQAPKFPQAMTLDFLLRWWARRRDASALAMVEQSYLAMVRGGIFDQVGGGFARYTVDATWLVPHFEKMLYDNALLAQAGVHLWQATGNAEVRRAVEMTFQWLGREMTSSAGGFYSSLDADSEGVEGKFYLWDEAELDALLGDDAALAKAYWGVTAQGNFEERNILHVPEDPLTFAAQHERSPAQVDAVIARARELLYRARARRVPPGRDEKILAAWNGLMLRALAEGARAFASEPLRAMALENGDFLFREMVRTSASGTRVFRSHKEGESRIPGFLEDHASVGLGALALYELTLDRAWLDRACALADSCLRWFWDAEAGAFFDSASDAESLVTRPRDPADNATPAGSSLAADLLLRLAVICGDVEYQRHAAWGVETHSEAIVRYATAFGHLLQVADMLVHGATELALVGEPGDPALAALAAAAGTRYVPALIVAGGAPGDNAGLALLADRPMQEGKATAYLCRGYVCEAPATSPALLVQQLAEVSAASGAQTYTSGG
ncbi:MAG: thioredoxin domain-containing protein [Gemmatimonadaceae bacterium]